MMNTHASLHRILRNIPAHACICSISPAQLVYGPWVSYIRSPADGLTISLINGTGMVTSQIAEISNEGPVIGGLSFIGRVTTDTRVLALAGGSAYSSFGDIIDRRGCTSESVQPGLVVALMSTLSSSGRYLT